MTHDLSRLPQHICQMGLLSLSGNSTIRYNSGPGVAIDMVALHGYRAASSESPIAVAGNLSPPGAVLPNFIQSKFSCNRKF